MTKNDIEPRTVNEAEPYELPAGWKWTRLGEVFSINPRVQADDALQASFVPMEKIEPDNKNMFSFSVEQWGKIKRNHTQFTDGDVCFAKISPCFENGKAFIARGLENGIGAGTTELIVLRNSEINSKYTFYFISNGAFIRKGRATYSGTVGQQRINMDFVKSYPFPLPPTLAEQQRIVSRIESLFTKLDEAKDKAQSVVDGFELRRAAILHKAFTGELTAKWRKEHGVSDDSWEEKTIGEWYSINPRIKAEDELSASFIPMEKIEANCANRFTYEVKLWGSIKKNHTQFADGDVCFAKISPCFENGKAFIAEGLENGIGAGTTELIILRNAEIDVHYTFYLITNADFVRGGCATYSGTVGQQRISMDYVRNYKIPVPTLAEQQEIVRILDTVLEKESRAKEAAGAVLDQIALLRKSILARAFRGEL